MRVMVKCPDCENGFQYSGRMDQPHKSICIECEGAGEISTESEDDNDTE